MRNPVLLCLSRHRSRTCASPFAGVPTALRELALAAPRRVLPGMDLSAGSCPRYKGREQGAAVRELKARVEPVGLRGLGLLLVTAASIFWSTAGLFVRMLDLDLWTMLGWRALFASLALVAVIVIRKGRQAGHSFASIGWPGLLAVPISAVSMVSFVVALKLTTVANVMTVYATVPVVAAGIA